MLSYISYSIFTNKHNTTQNFHFRYTLSAKGSFPIAFDQIQELTYIHKGYSVFIQTDKSVYR